MKTFLRIFAAVITIGMVLGLCPAARAQFASQATYVATSSGTNTITVALPNVSQLADIKGVPIRVLMLNSNTSAATLNVQGTGATAIQKPTPTGLAALVGGEIVAAQVSTFMYDGTVFELLQPNLNLATVPAQSGFNAPVNLQINCTAAANALTCAMKAANTGNDATALAPIYIPFRDATITNGGPIWRTLTSAVSFTISGGNTMGCASTAPCRLWITAIDNAGTVLLGLSNQSGTSQLFPLNEAALQTTGSGTGGGNTAGTIFTSVSAVSTKAVRIIGYVEWTSLTVAGNWTSPNLVQLMGPGIKKPGDVLQSLQMSTQTETSTSSATPQPTGVHNTLTLTSAANAVRIHYGGTGGVGGNTDDTVVALYRGSNACTTQIGPKDVIVSPANNSLGTPIGRTWLDLTFAGATTSAAYTVCLFTLNGGVITGRFPYEPAAGSNTGVMILEEVMGANDNEATNLPVPSKAA